MKFIVQILSDYKGIVRVCGFIAAMKWLLFIFLTLPQCIRHKNLQPADKLFGEGPVAVKSKNGKVNLSGGQIFSSIREIWVREVYTKDNYVSIPDEGVVVDLGANVGAFTMLALANSKTGKVISVEPNTEFNKLLMHQVTNNNFNDRIILQRYFIGSLSSTQKEMFKDPDSKDAQFITQKEFIELNKLSRIDFLKCDIEGSEFDFIDDTSLLQITNQLAIEIHFSAGNRNSFIDKLKELGFTIGPIKDDQGSCILLARRS
jgi:FkbM family methyltransferase